MNAQAHPPVDDADATAYPAWHFRLYVAGQSPRSLTALMNLYALCHTYLQPGYQLDIIDLLDDPGRAAVDQILAIPTLVRLSPGPRLRVVGDLTDIERVVQALGLGAS